MTSTEIANASKIMIGSTEAVKMYIGSTLIYQAWTPNANGHAYVDLGLPSGTLWATMNIGANDITDIGDCYSYGGTTAYSYCQSKSYYSGYQPHLPSSKDIAVQTWGGDWHIPTKEQFDELVANTTYTWETDFDGSGVNGGKFTATNGNYIFMPTKDSMSGNYQSSTPQDSSWNYSLHFTSSETIGATGSYRGNTYFVRPVADNSNYLNTLMLPTGYTELGYISSTSGGNQYINLDIKLYEVKGTNYDIATKFNITVANANQAAMFSCQDSDNNPWPGTFIRVNSSTSKVIGRYIGGSAKDNTLGSLGEDIELYTQTPPGKNVTNLNNNNTTHQYGTSLFCAFVGGTTTPDRYCYGTLYYFKLFVNGTLVRYLIPCKNSNNVVGMYDVVNNVFYTSPNGNAFVAGPAV